MRFVRTEIILVFLISVISVFFYYLLLLRSFFSSDFNDLIIYLYNATDTSLILLIHEVDFDM